VGVLRHVWQIPSGSGVLRKLGFSTNTLYFDMMSLFIYLTVALAIAFVTLKVFVREQR
jgi:hypothetical protein